MLAPVKLREVLVRHQWAVSINTELSRRSVNIDVPRTLKSKQSSAANTNLLKRDSAMYPIKPQ